MHLPTPALQITDDIPPPLPRTGPTHAKSWPLASLEVGQSFTIPLGDEQRRNTRMSIASIISRYGTNNQKRFVTRTVDDGASLRVWRTA
jgi:hypothetical protein